MDASRCSAADGVEAAIPGWVAADCIRVSGQDLSEEIAVCADLVRAAINKELAARQSFGDCGRSAVDFRRVGRRSILTWKIAVGV